MKKILLILALACSTLASLRADLIWYEDFNYADGPIIATSTNLAGTVTNWFRHSGSAAPSDSIVAGKKLQVSCTNPTQPVPNRQDDVNRKLGSPYSSTLQVLYASFTVNCTNLPTATNYIGSFIATATTGFYARTYGLPGVLPNTWRLGIAGAASAVSMIFPVDLATNTDYQVVIEWDPVTLYAATLWVNPVNSADANVVSGDAVTSPLTDTAFAFRQAQSPVWNAFFNITNASTATTFSEAATAVWPTTPVNPLIVYSPKDVTNFVGTASLLSGVAAGQGLGSMTYTWLKNSGIFTNPDGNTNTLNFPSPLTTDSGFYQLVATTPNGLSATSAPAYLSVSAAPVPPVFSQHPSNTTAYFHQTVTLPTIVSGPETITCQWYYHPSYVAPTAPNFAVSGTHGETLTITDVFSNNDTATNYVCVASNPYGSKTSAVATVSAIAAPVVTIGYLRTLVDPVYFLPTNTTAYYTASGIVTVHGTLTATPNLSIVMQDDTGGIGVFMLGGIGAGIYPAAGDRITVTGPLGKFNGGLQFNLSSTDPSQSIIINSSGNLLPPGVVLPFNFTNGAAVGGVGDALRLYGSRVVTFTNVYFPAADGVATFAAGSTYYMTNNNGESFRLFLNAAMINLNGLVIPPFAWTISAPMGVFLGDATVDRSSGYEMFPTDPGDIVITPPPQVTVSVALSGGNPVLTWTAQPYMSYTVLRATVVNGPYVPIAGGLTFNTTAGQYTDTSGAPSTRFYRVTSP